MSNKLIQVTLASALIVACALSALAGPISQDTCTTDVSEYLRAIKIDSSIQVLVDELDRHYPRFGELIERIPTKEFLNSMTSIGPQKGCDHLVEHINQVDLLVPCFEDRFDAEGLVDLANEDANVKPIVKSYYACLASVSFDQEDLTA